MPCLAVAGVGTKASKPPLSMERAVTGGLKQQAISTQSADRGLLQQNRHEADKKPCPLFGR
jgi:hypothetical protein